MMFFRQYCAFCVLVFATLSVSYAQNDTETVPPLGVEILTLGPLAENKQTILVCKATGAGPHTTITWWLEGTILPSTVTKDNKSNTIVTSQLKFTPLKKHHGVSLKCRAENENMNGTAIENKMDLNVYYAPSVTMRLGHPIRNDSIKEYDDIFFVCRVKANPRPHEVTWEHNGVRLERNTYVHMSNTILALQNLSTLFNGEYTCKASNVEGSGVSQPLTIRVQHKPRCKSNETTLIDAKLLEPVKLECDVEAYPPPDIFQWTLTSDEIVNMDRKTLTMGHGKSVTFTPVSGSDYGALQCRAANRQGQQESPCTFILQAPSPPQTPRH